MIALTAVFLIVGAIALIPLVKHRRSSAVLAAALLLPAIVLVSGLIAGRTASADAFHLTVATRPADAGTENVISLSGMTYAQSKAALRQAETDGEGSLLFSSITGTGITGLQRLESSDAVATYDDSAFDFVVRGSTSFLDHPAELLVSARWKDPADTEPELAVFLKIDSVDLSVLNPSWTQVPVQLGSAIVGLASIEHTLLPSETLGTDTFFTDDEGNTENFLVRPSGVSLQAVLEDGPLLEGADVLGAVEKIRIKGSVGESGVLNPADNRPTTGLNLTAEVSVSTPDPLKEVGIVLDTNWLLTIRANTGVSYFASFEGDAQLDLGASPMSFGASVSVNHTTTSTTFTLSGSVGDVEDLFGQSWFDLDNLTLTGLLSRNSTTNQTEVGLTMDADFTLGGVSSGVTLAARTNLATGEVTTSLTLEVTEDVSIDKILEDIGAPISSAGADLRTVTLTNFGLFVSVKAGGTTPTTVTVAATGGASILQRGACTTGGDPFPGADADMLFRMQSGGGAATSFFIGGRLSGLSLNQISCDIPFDWTLPTVTLMAANVPITNAPWATLDAPTKTFFEQSLCPGAIVCPTQLNVPAGLTMQARVSLGQDMADALDTIGISVSGPLVISGTLPILGGTTTDLSVTLPQINGGPEDLVAGGTVAFKIKAETTGVEASITGNMQFRIARPNVSTCTNDPGDGWFAATDRSGAVCYDTLDLSVAIGVSVSVDSGLELKLMGQIANWQNAFGEPNFTINTFRLELTIGVDATGVALSIGLYGNLLIGDTDLVLAILAEIGVAPPRIFVKGFTVGTAKGISLTDIVRTFDPNLSTNQLPDEISLKNLWLAYGTETNTSLCIREGFYLSAELHINDPDPDNSAGTNPVCGTTVPHTNPRSCSPGETSCIAAVLIDIGPSKFIVYGALSGFDIGPISFGGAEVLLEITPLRQQFYLEGSATLYDPIDYYIPPTGTDKVWASGYLKIEFKQESGVVELGLTGCALVGGTAVAGPDCLTSADTVFAAGVEGKIRADFTKVGMTFFEHAEAEFELTLDSPALKKLIEDIEESLQPAIEWLEQAGEAIEGAVKEVVSDVEQGFCRAFNIDCDSIRVTAEAYDSAPAYINAQINATDAAIRDSAAVGIHCFFTSITDIDGCYQGFRDAARSQNNAAIAAAGGPEYIALHGINRTGFLGIVDTLDSNLYWVNPTRFQYPAAGTPAPCATGGELAGMSICSAAPGQVPDVDDLIGPALLEALEEIDPALAAIFAANQLGNSNPTGQMLAQTTETDYDTFLDQVRTLSDRFDSNHPLSICEAVATYSWSGPDGEQPGPVSFDTKVAAYGANANIPIDINSGADNNAELDNDAINSTLLGNVLQEEIEDLECPTTAGDESEGSVSFSMSSSSLSEGETLTLTGSAPANASVTIGWGEDSATSTVNANGEGSWTASYTYKDGPNFFIVSATSGESTAQTPVTVLNVSPTIVATTLPADVDEGSEVTISGSFTDPGVLDTHSVTVDWGDGTSSDLSLPAGSNGQFSLTHSYDDDDPTLTPSDLYSVTLEVRDKDGAKAQSALGITVRNVAPSDLVLESATTSAGEVERDDGGRLMVPEGTEVTWTGTFRDPGLGDEHSFQIAWGDGSLSTPTIERDAQDPALVHFTVTHTFVDDEPTGTESDLYEVLVHVFDDDSGSASFETTVRVLNVAPEVTVEPDTQTVQYSDPIDDITITATDVRGIVRENGSWSEVLQLSLRWQVDGGAWQTTGLPADLALTSNGCEVLGDPASRGAMQECTWEITGLVNVAPGLYTFEASVTDDDTGTTVQTFEIEVLPEDARANYTGPEIYSSLSLVDGYADVHLRATVRDISVVPGIVPSDENPGDITNATVTFINRDTGQELCTTPVTPIFVGDTTTGGASCIGRLELAPGEEAKAFNIGIVVGGWYSRDDSADDGLIWVHRHNDSFVTTGGFVVVPDSAGTVPADVGTQLKPSFNPKFYHPRYDHIRGRGRLLFDVGGKSHEIEVTHFESMGIREGPNGEGLAWIEAEARLLDTSVPGRGDVIADDLHLQFWVSDADDDTVGWALWNDDGLLISSSGWDGSSVPDAPLSRGNLVVRLR